MTNTMVSTARLHTAIALTTASDTYVHLQEEYDDLCRQRMCSGYFRPTVVTVVIATGTSGRHWRDFTTNEKRDLTMGGAMGQTTAAALRRPGAPQRAGGAV